MRPRAIPELGFSSEDCDWDRWAAITTLARRTRRSSCFCPELRNACMNPDPGPDTTGTPDPPPDSRRGGQATGWRLLAVRRFDGGLEVRRVLAVPGPEALKRARPPRPDVGIVIMHRRARTRCWPERSCVGEQGVGDPQHSCSRHDEAGSVEQGQPEAQRGPEPPPPSHRPVDQLRFDTRHRPPFRSGADRPACVAAG